MCLSGQTNKNSGILLAELPNLWPICRYLGIQSYSQLMIGMSNHLLSVVFRFHYHSQKVIGSLGDIRPWYSQGIMDYLHFPEMAEMSEWRHGSEYGVFYPSTGVAWGILSGLATRCWLHLVTNGRLAGPNRGNETMKIHMLSFTVSFVAVAMVSRDKLLDRKCCWMFGETRRHI